MWLCGIYIFFALGFVLSSTSIGSFLFEIFYIYLDGVLYNYSYLFQLGLLKRIAKRKSDPRLYADELGKGLVGELDYNLEAGNASEFLVLVRICIFHNTLIFFRGLGRREYNSSSGLFYCGKRHPVKLITYYKVQVYFLYNLLLLLFEFIYLFNFFWV